MSINFVLMLLAFLCFIAGSVGLTARVNLIALGLAFWSLAILIGGAPR